MKLLEQLSCTMKLRTIAILFCEQAHFRVDDPHSANNNMSTVTIGPGEEVDAGYGGTEGHYAAADFGCFREVVSQQWLWRDYHS